jgi:hypothetical protein
MGNHRLARVWRWRLLLSHRGCSGANAGVEAAGGNAFCERTRARVPKKIGAALRQPDG